MGITGIKWGPININYVNYAKKIEVTLTVKRFKAQVSIEWDVRLAIEREWHLISVTLPTPTIRASIVYNLGDYQHDQGS